MCSKHQPLTPRRMMLNCLLHQQIQSMFLQCLYQKSFDYEKSSRRNRNNHDTYNDRKLNNTLFLWSRSNHAVFVCRFCFSKRHFFAFCGLICNECCIFCCFCCCICVGILCLIFEVRISLFSSNCDTSLNFVIAFYHTINMKENQLFFMPLK